MHRRTAQSTGQIIGQMSGPQVIGLDIAKNVFQLHTVDMSTGEIVKCVTLVSQLSMDLNVKEENTQCELLDEMELRGCATHTSLGVS